MVKKRKNLKKKPKKQLSKQDLNRLSKRNAYKIITGTDKLKSWGYTGWYKSKKNGEWFHYRSSIELAVLKIIDESEYVVDFDTECFAIEYDWGGVTCRYIPDIILKTKNDKTFVVEVKPKKELKNPRNKAKWEKAKKWCFEQGCKFIVITEKDKDNLIPILENIEAGKTEEAIKLMEWKIFE